MSDFAGPSGEARAALSATIAIFRRLGIRHALLGGAAMDAHGGRSGTRDVDILVHVDAEHLGRLREAFRTDGFAASRRSGGGLPRSFESYSRDGVSVDLFPDVSPFARAVLDKAVERPVWGCTVATASLEDLIAIKLQLRRGKDLGHLFELVRLASPGFDVEYARRQSALLECRENQACLWESRPGHDHEALMYPGAAAGLSAGLAAGIFAGSLVLARSPGAALLGAAAGGGSVVLGLGLAWLLWRLRILLRIGRRVVWSAVLLGLPLGLAAIPAISLRGEAGLEGALAAAVALGWGAAAGLVAAAQPRPVLPTWSGGLFRNRGTW